MSIAKFGFFDSKFYNQFIIETEIYIPHTPIQLEVCVESTREHSSSIYSFIIFKLFIVFYYVIKSHSCILYTQLESNIKYILYSAGFFKSDLI